MEIADLLDNNDIVLERQYGLQRTKSTSDALFQLVNKDMDLVNENDKVILLVLSIDLAKGFRL